MWKLPLLAVLQLIDWPNSLSKEPGLYQYRRMPPPRPGLIKGMSYQVLVIDEHRGTGMMKQEKQDPIL